MTYPLFLLLFLILPIAASAWVLHPRSTDAPWWPLGALLVFVYAATIPWDSAAVARGLWSFDPARTWRPRLWGLPVEELLFFGLQAVLTGLWVRRRLAGSVSAGAAR
jgi:lycopene cyclase domain-containing protein